jgi:AcrR family transcriptional regulator
MNELPDAFPPSDARNAIMAAALTLFAEHGFHGVGTRAIAEAAGISQPLLNHHFGGKAGLWRQVGEQITADFLKVLGEAVDPALPADEAVLAMLRAYLAYWKARPRAFRFNQWRRLDGLPEERQARSGQMTRHGVAFMQRAQAMGAIRPDLPPGLALVIGGGLIQFWLESQLEIREALAVSGDEDLDDEAFVQYLMKLIRA